MPQDTINVSLVTSRIQASKPNYYNPLLVYKAAKIKVNKDNDDCKILSLTVNNYEQQIETLEKDTGDSNNQFEKEKTLLKTAMTVFFQFKRRVVKISYAFYL